MKFSSLMEDGFDYDETFSPVIKITTVRILLSFVISKKRFIHQLDVFNAFLHGELQEIIFMEQPPSFVNKSFPHHVCQLKKSLYGLKQAPWALFLKLSNYLLSLSFSTSKIDTSLFFKYHNQIRLFFLIYVDDILLISPDFAEITSLIYSLISPFSMRDLGPAHFPLALNSFLQQMGIFSLSPNTFYPFFKKLIWTRPNPSLIPVRFLTLLTPPNLMIPPFIEALLGPFDTIPLLDQISLFLLIKLVK